MESNQEGTFQRKFASEGSSETRVLKVLEIVVIIVLACMIQQFCCHQMIMMENRSKFVKLHFVTDIVK